MIYALKHKAQKNFMITVWLVKFMDLEMDQTYMFLPITKEIWEIVMKTYSNIRDLD